MKRLLFLFPFFVCTVLNAQYARLNGLNFTSFTKHVKANEKEIKGLIDERFYNHPDLGLLPFNAPGKDSLIELIDRRTSDSRYYVKSGSQGKKFLIEKSYTPINYRDENGFLREIDFHLRPTVAPHIFSADRQRSPITIDMDMKEITFFSNMKKISLAKNIRLVHVDINGKKHSLGQGNWSDYTAGDEGVIVHNFYPDIDLVFSVRESKIETDFIINKPLHLNGGYLMMQQGFEAFDNLNIPYTYCANPQEYYITDSSNNIYFTIDKCYAFSNDEKSTAIALFASFDDGELSVFTPVEWLNDNSTVYPVVIDPVVTAADSLLAATILGTKYSAVCWTNSCDYFLSIPPPPNSTITSVATSFSYQAIAACSGVDGGFSIDYSTCHFPSVAPGVMTAPSIIVGVNQGLITEFNSCFPTPSCNPANMDFTLHFYRCNNDPDPNCAANCIRAYDDWVMYITGQTLELTYFTPNMNICGGTTVDLVAVPDFGVPPYNFVWNASSVNNDTLSVTPNVTTYYSVSITDLCGTNIVANDTIFVEPNNNPGFTISPVTACINENISLSGNGSSAVTDYDWVVTGSNVSGGIINDDQNPTIHYTLPGTYNVTLRFYNANCMYFDSTIAITITAQSTPDVTVAPTVAGPYCQGDVLHFTASPVNGGTAPTYDWIVDGSVMQTGVADTFSTAALNNGSIVQVVLHSNSGCVSTPIDTASTFIALNSAVVPDITISPDTAVCPGSPVTFSFNSINGGTNPTYQWFVNGVVVPGATSSTFNTTINANDSLVSVEMISSLGCVTTPNSYDTTVVVQLQNTTPQIDLLSDASSALCSGDTIHFNASSQFGGSAPLFQWFVNGVATTGMSPDSTYNFIAGSGIDSVSVQITSSVSCLANPTSADHEIVQSLISLMPSVAITTNPVVVCEGQPLNFIAQPHYGGTAPDFEWFVNGVSSGSTNIFSPGVLNNGDSVSVLMNSSVPCAIQSDVSNYFLISNLPSPTADFTYSNPAPGAFLNILSFENTSINANSWVWYFPADSDTVYSKDPVHEFSDQGVYEVILVAANSNGCVDSIAYLVSVLEETAVFWPRAFTPNGDNINEFFQPIGASLNEYEFRIFNRWGQEIFVGNEKKPWYGTVKDSSTPAPEGVYIYHLEAKDLDLDDRTINGRVTLIR